MRILYAAIVFHLQLPEFDMIRIRRDVSNFLIEMMNNNFIEKTLVVKLLKMRKLKSLKKIEFLLNCKYMDKVISIM